MQRLIQISTEKCINISIIQVSFLYILKIGAIKTIKNSVKIIVNTTIRKSRNAKCIN